MVWCDGINQLILFQLKVGSTYEIQGQVDNEIIHGYCLYPIGEGQLRIRSAAIDLTNIYANVLYWDPLLPHSQKTKKR